MRTAPRPLCIRAVSALHPRCVRFAFGCVRSASAVSPLCIRPASALCPLCICFASAFASALHPLYIRSVSALCPPQEDEEGLDEEGRAMRALLSKERAVVRSAGLLDESSSEEEARPRTAPEPPPNRP